MSKKFASFLFIVIFFSSFHTAYAALTINEIMYDLSGSDSTSGKSREWVEVYNPDSSVVFINASSWRIYDGGANRTINGEVNFSIPAGAYVIFAGDKDTFLADHAGFSGTVYDTGISSLNNTGATLKILDQDGNVVDSVTYASSQGGGGDGNSLQKISSSWSGAVSTPGAANEASVSPPSASGGLASSSSDNGNSSDQTLYIKDASETKNKITEEPKIKTEILAKNLVFAGTPLPLMAVSFNYSKEPIHFGKYFWNFGDGDSKEMQVNSSEKLTHTYLYSGDYVLTLEYYMNSYSETPDASAKITVTVLSADISISRVGEGNDFFIELANNTNYDADISGWILSSGTKTFTFPKNTFLSPRKKMTVPGNLTHFSLEDKNNLKLTSSQGQIIFDYGASIASAALALVPTPIISRSEEIVVQEQNKTQKELLSEASKNRNTEEPESEEDAPDLDLEASVVENNSDNSYMPMIASTMVIGVSAGAVYFIRRNRISGLTAGNDFKILDE